MFCIDHFYISTVEVARDLTHKLSKEKQPYFAGLNKVIKVLHVPSAG